MNERDTHWLAVAVAFSNEKGPALWVIFPLPQAMPVPSPDHATWTRNLISREPFTRFAKWADPTRFNFRIAVRHRLRPGRACAWLYVPPVDFAEFSDAYNAVRGRYYVWVEENMELPFRFFLDIDAHDRGFTAEELGEVLHAAMPQSPFWLLSKSNAGESTRWHVVAEAPIHRTLPSFREATETLIESLQGSVLGRRLAAAIDSNPLASLRLRAPDSVKVYGGPEEIDENDYYRIVAHVGLSGGVDTIDHHGPWPSHLAFISSPTTPPTRSDIRAWTSLGAVLPVPDFRAVLPFNYYKDILDPDAVEEVVANVLRDTAHSPEDQLDLDSWGQIQDAVVNYFDQYCAHVQGEGVYVVVPPKNVATKISPGQTVVLPSNTHKFFSHSAFMTCYGGIGTVLWRPNTKKPDRVSWARVWLQNTRVYATSMQYSKPLGREEGDARPPPRTFNLWTGPGVSPQDAFAAVRRNPARAKEVVEFFNDFLKNVVCGDPFEDPLYNAYAYRLVLHLLIFCSKQPHDTFPAIFYMWSPEQGVGKGQLTNVLMALIGVMNTFNTVGVNGVQGNFAGYVAEKLLLVLDEESDRKKQAEAYGLLKHLATDPLLTADKKFRDSETVNNFLKIIATSNILWPIPIEDRRVFSLAVNPVHHRDTAYWNKFMEMVFGGDGIRYIAAWVYGMKPHPDFHPGITIPKGYVRVRQADRVAANLDPLQAVIHPWLSTVTPEGDIERFEASAEIPMKCFLDQWFEGGEPRGHFNQPMLGQLLIDKAKLIELCSKHGHYSTHSLRGSVLTTFGDKNACLFPTQRQGHRYTRTVWATRDTFVEEVMAVMTRCIEEARVHRIGNDCVADVWPINQDRLRLFATSNVIREPKNGIVEYSVCRIVADYGEPVDANVLIWPDGHTIRDMFFGDTDGGRTPIADLPVYTVNWAWHRSGFEDIHEFGERWMAEQSVGEGPPDPAREARRAAEAEVARREWAEMWAEN